MSWREQAAKYLEMKTISQANHSGVDFVHNGREEAGPFSEETIIYVHGNNLFYFFTRNIYSKVYFEFWNTYVSGLIILLSLYVFVNEVFRDPSFFFRARQRISFTQTRNTDIH